MLNSVFYCVCFLSLRIIVCPMQFGKCLLFDMHKDMMVQGCMRIDIKEKRPLKRSCEIMEGINIYVMHQICSYKRRVFLFVAIDFSQVQLILFVSGRVT